MQEFEDREFSEAERDLLIILSNTAKVYNYTLSEEYMLSLLKRNGMNDYIQEYSQMIKENNLNIGMSIINLGDSSLQRFLINKEKRVYQFPPNETDDLFIVRDVE